MPAPLAVGVTIIVHNGAVGDFVHGSTAELASSANDDETRVRRAWRRGIVKTNDTFYLESTR
jgi:hypothetical protein